MKKPPKPFDATAARLHHSEAQSRPHPAERVKRIEARGVLVAQFFFPLTELKPRDRTRKEKAWQAKCDRDKVLSRMVLDYVRWRTLTMRHFALPLGGRPLVRCIRYSSVEPDAFAGWGKVAVDCLQPGGVRKVSRKARHPSGHTVILTRDVPYGGLGIIRNDRPADCEVVEWWEPAKAKAGFCVVEVWTG